MSNMITIDLLRRRHKLICESMKELHLGSEHIPMFTGVMFNDKNWNGGESVIRQFFYELNYGNHVYKNDVECIKIGYKIDDDDNNVEINWIRNVNRKVDVYRFSWYKNRGNTGIALCNGEVLQIGEYIELLEVIQRLTDFEFELEIEEGE